jgi:hypothetical protein
MRTLRFAVPILLIFSSLASAAAAAPADIEPTVRKLLAAPVYTTSDEQRLNSAGDSAAVVITRIVSNSQMNAPDVARRILLIVHLAFEDPQSISNTADKTPTVTMQLLHRLEQTNYGRQLNVIDNARHTIEYAASSGTSMESAMAGGEPLLDRAHTQWIETVMAYIATIKVGMTRSDLLKVFTTEGGLSTRTHQTYVLKQCPYIKVDVEFSPSTEESTDKITKISRPYLYYSIVD